MVGFSIYVCTRIWNHQSIKNHFNLFYRFSEFPCQKGAIFVRWVAVYQISRYFVAESNMQAYSSTLGGQPASSFVQNPGFYAGSFYPAQSSMCNYVRNSKDATSYLGYTPHYSYGEWIYIYVQSYWSHGTIVTWSHGTILHNTNICIILSWGFLCNKIFMCKILCFAI